jgi:hypothetical protein
MWYKILMCSSNLFIIVVSEDILLGVQINTKVLPMHLHYIADD